LSSLTACRVCYILWPIPLKVGALRIVHNVRERPDAQCTVRLIVVTYLTGELSRFIKHDAQQHVNASSSAVNCGIQIQYPAINQHLIELVYNFSGDFSRDLHIYQSSGLIVLAIVMLVGCGKDNSASSPDISNVILGGSAVKGIINLGNVVAEELDTSGRAIARVDSGDCQR